MNEHVNTIAGPPERGTGALPRKILASQGSDTEAFLRKILARQGRIAIALLKQRKGGGKPYWVHHKCATVEEAVATIEALNTAGVTVYHACSTYKEDRDRGFRTQNNAGWQKSFWVDADVEAGNPAKYGSKREAMQDVLRVCKELRLCAPTVVDSGGGLHLYWSLTEDVTTAVWTPLAQQFKDRLTALGFKQDPSRTADSASVLRPAGTHNRKTDPPRLVKVVVEGKDITLEQFAAALGTNVPAPIMAMPEEDDDLGGGIEYPPSSADRIIQFCPTLAHVAALQGNVPEPLWHKMIGVVKHTTEGVLRCHEWSVGHPEYSEYETQQKIDNWATGPSTCTSIRQVMENKCEGCTQTCKSPIQLGYSAEATAPAVAVKAAAVSPNVSETLNDATNADRFIATYGERLRYVYELKLWIAWLGRHWQYDRKGNVIDLAKDVAKALFEEAARAAGGDRNAMWRWANNSLQLGRLEAMVKLAQPKLSVSSSELDADPLLLGVRNGVVDLRNGAFRQAHPEDLITKIANVEYDAGATCPTWEATVGTCMGGNGNLVAFLQRAGGYSLAGLISEQVFFFLHGAGANGKTTFVNVIREIMGGYAVQSQPDIIMVQRNSNPSGPTPEIARLAGVRLAAMTETEEGQQVAESRLKQVTGGDVIVARVLQGSPFEFIPQFKLWLSGNHKPIIRGDDHGIWRRIMLIPFTVEIPPAQRDKHLPERLRAEYPGILNWLIQGCLDWQRQGLSPPAEVTREVDQYKSSMDLLAQWLNEQCVVSPQEEGSARQAYEDYANWAKGGGHRAITEVRFAQKLEERGFTKKRTKEGQRYFGFAIRQMSLALSRATKGRCRVV